MPRKKVKPLAPTPLLEGVGLLKTRSAYAEFSRSTVKHGHRVNNTCSLTYNSWRAMKQRCQNTSHRFYPDYGGRGITVCKEWEGFETFLADMGERPSKLHSLDRINVDGPYCKENCKWALPEEQRANRRDSAPEEEILPLEEWGW